MVFIQLFLVRDCLLFSAHIKFEARVVKTSCNIYTWDGSARCSDIFLYTSKNEVRQYIRVGQIITYDPDSMAGMLSITTLCAIIFVFLFSNNNVTH